MSILITAASGNIGRPLVSNLLSSSDNPKLILTTSNAHKLASSCPTTANNDHIIIEEGALSDPDWLQSLCIKHNVTTVFLNLNGTDELFTTINALDAFARSGTVKHLIYVSAAGDFTSNTGAKSLLKSDSGAHTLVKVIAEQKLLYGGYPFTWTVLGPTLFFSNDLDFEYNLLHEGRKIEPLGSKGLSRVSVSDIALVAAKAIHDGGKTLSGKKIMIGSLHRYTNADVEALWSKALGRHVHITGTSEEEFEEYAKITRAALDSVWARSLVLMYRYFAAEGYGMDQEQYRFQCEVLGREPEAYEDWVDVLARKGRGEVDEVGGRA